MHHCVIHFQHEDRFYVVRTVLLCYIMNAVHMSVLFINHLTPFSTYGCYKGVKGCKLLLHMKPFIGQLLSDKAYLILL